MLYLTNRFTLFLNLKQILKCYPGKNSTHEHTNVKGALQQRVMVVLNNSNIIVELLLLAQTYLSIDACRHTVRELNSIELNQ